MHNTVTGKMTIEEWADIAIVGIDNVKERIVNEGELRYIGGKLKFLPVGNDHESVSMYFELYFLDESESWHKADAGIDVSAYKFDDEALEQIRSTGAVVFEVE